MSRMCVSIMFNFVIESVWCLIDYYLNDQVFLKVSCILATLKSIPESISSND